ncbi:MAG: nodulation protein NfeD [Aigarchaeota archaeon]|nr:nodulation protein NfeD [Candidatus Pelearchaeum maunauluense]
MTRAASITIAIFLISFSALLAASDSYGSTDERRVLWLELNGYVSPGMAEYVEESLSNAGDYAAVLITLDTFGGLGDAMFRIIDAILESPTPVIGFVYPAGKQALSAGTYILMATDYAAMAPYTLIGSAQPVVGGQPSNETKLINFLTAKMSSLAELHKRNATQAVRFITHNDNLGPEEALRLRVIEAIADSPEELLQKADGATVYRLGGERTLDLNGARLVKVEPSIRSSVIGLFSDPLVSSLLLSIGILVLILGFTSPGWGAEVAGGIMIVLGLLGQGFNVNIIGILLAAIGAGLIIFELHTPGFGAAGLGGIFALTLGLILLIGYPPYPIYVSEEWLQQLYFSIGVSTIVAGGIFVFLIYKALRIQKRKSYFEKYLGDVGKAIDDLSPGKEGYILVSGEYWRATSRTEIRRGQRVRIVGRRDGLLLVEPADE